MLNSATANSILASARSPPTPISNLTINYAGPAGTFPRRLALRFRSSAARDGKQRATGKMGSRAKWSCSGPDNIDDRHATPFYTAFGLTDKWTTPGVEIHANTLRTLLTGDFLKPVPDWRSVGRSARSPPAPPWRSSTSFAASPDGIWSLVLLLRADLRPTCLFRPAGCFPVPNIAACLRLSLIGGIIYRFATAEKKSSFFKSAVALFVGKQVAQSLDRTDKIALTGKRQMVTILFTDIRGFTAFCESKDPAVVVDLLNVYMSTMCRHHRQVPRPRQ